MSERTGCEQCEDAYVESWSAYNNADANDRLIPMTSRPPQAARYAFNIRLIVICILEPNSAGSENIIYVSHMLYPRRAR